MTNMVDELFQRHRRVGGKMKNMTMVRDQDHGHQEMEAIRQEVDGNGIRRVMTALGHRRPRQSHMKQVQGDRIDTIQDHTLAVSILAAAIDKVPIVEAMKKKTSMRKRDQGAGSRLVR